MDVKTLARPSGGVAEITRNLAPMTTGTKNVKRGKNMRDVIINEL